MATSRAEGAPRLLRLALSAAAASAGAVGLSVLLGASAATAADEPASIAPLGTAVALVDDVAVLPEATSAVTDVAAPVAEALVPVAAAVSHAAEPVAPVAEAVAPIAAPALDPVIVVVERTAAEAIAPVAAPVVETADATLEVLPIVRRLVGDAPVSGVLEPLVDPVLEVVPRPELEVVPRPVVAVLDAEQETAAHPAPLASAQPIEADLAAVAADPHTDPGALGPTGASAAPWPERRGAWQAPAAVGDDGRAEGATGAVEQPRPAAAPLEATPAGASGVGGGGAPSPADLHDLVLPGLAGGTPSAVARDRAPASPVEEGTASPD